MSIEFSINQYDEERCYCNSMVGLKTLLTALYSAEHPYGALMRLDGNERIEIADFAYDEQSGKVTYSIDFDNDTIIRSEKDKQFKLNGISKMPLGAAYSLLRFHGEPLPWTVSDYEYMEHKDMSELFGDLNPEAKERGFIIGMEEKYFNYLKSTKGYDFLRTVVFDKTCFLAFDQRGFDNIKTFLSEGIHEKRAEINRLEAEFNKAFPQKDRMVADTFNVVSAVRIDENNEIVMGFRETGFGTNYATWQCSGGDNYYWGHYNFPTAEAATLDMYNRVVEALQNKETRHSESNFKESDLSEFPARLNLDRKSYTFSLVTIDDVKSYVTGSYIGDADDLAELGILEQFDGTFPLHDNTVSAKVGYYIIGKNDTESVNLPEVYCGDIMSHLDAALEYADLLEERSIKVDCSEFEDDEYEDDELEE